jgi:hypothetical protein
LTTLLCDSGCKSDLRNDYQHQQAMAMRGLSAVTTFEAETLARKFNAPYMECSGFTQENLVNSFNNALTYGIEKRLAKKKKKRRTYACAIM